MPLMPGIEDLGDDDVGAQTTGLLDEAWAVGDLCDGIGHLGDEASEMVSHHGVIVSEEHSWSHTSLLKEA